MENDILNDLNIEAYNADEGSTYANESIEFPQGGQLWISPTQGTSVTLGWNGATTNPSGLAFTYNIIIYSATTGAILGKLTANSNFVTISKSQLYMLGILTETQLQFQVMAAINESTSSAAFTNKSSIFTFTPPSEDIYFTSDQKATLKDESGASPTIFWTAATVVPDTKNIIYSVKITKDNSEGSILLSKNTWATSITFAEDELLSAGLEDNDILYFTVTAKIYGGAITSPVAMLKAVGPFTFIPSINTVLYYNGTSWEECIVYYYTGSEWQQCIPYYYNGSDFVEINSKLK